MALSKERRDYIMSLQQTSINVGGKPKVGYLDKEKGLFYETDADGEPTGRCASIEKAKRPEPPTPPPADDPEDTEDHDGAPESEAANGNQSRAALFVQKYKFALIGGIVAVTLLFLFLVVVRPMLGGKKPTDAPPTVTGGVEETDIPTGQPQEYEVVQLARTVLKGQTIAPDDLKAVTISASLYEQFLTFGRDLYLWDRADRLVGNFASKYMQADHYVEQTDISVGRPYGVNPWMDYSGNSISVLIPIEPETASNILLTYGTYIDLNVQKRFANQVAVGQQGAEGEDPEGVAHTSSVEETFRTEEYLISKLTVCDILNADQNSIYNTYAAYSGIPVGERYDYISTAMWNDGDLYRRLTPAYIVVNVTQEQAQTIGNTNSSDTKISVILHGDWNMTTDVRESFALEAINVRKTIEQTATDNQKRAEDEALAKQQAAEEALRKQQESTR